MTYPFRLEQVAEGVWAALVQNGTGTAGNAGIVDLGEKTLVIDTFQTLTAARALRAAAEELTGRPAAYVVNTHFHSDHVHGNQVFADAVIIATERTRDLMSAHMSELLASGRETLPRQLMEREAQMARESDPFRRQNMEWRLANHRTLLAELPEMHVTPAAVTCNDRLVLHGSRRSVEVLAVGPGHTEGDAIVWLPDEGIAFVGDLVLVQHHMWMGHGQADKWLTVLDRLEQLPLRVLVPGHGELGGAANIPPARQYIRDMLALVDALVHEGKNPADAVVSEAYRSWGSPDVFNWNVGTFFERLQPR